MRILFTTQSESLRMFDALRAAIGEETGLEEYHSDEAALEAYVAATFEESESVNLYSVLLNKKGVHADRQTDYGEEIERLAAYAIARLRAPDETPGGPVAADW